MDNALGFTRDSPKAMTGTMEDTSSVIIIIEGGGSGSGGSNITIIIKNCYYYWLFRGNDIIGGLQKF
jgi:hypothetical protein